MKLGVWYGKPLKKRLCCAAVRVRFSVLALLDGHFNARRADYGKQIMATLSQQLVIEFGSGFSEKNLRRMAQFAENFPDEQIVVTLLRQLSWTHFIIHVAEYITELPPRDVLVQKLHAVIERSRRHLEEQADD